MSNRLDLPKSSIIYPFSCLSTELDPGLFPGDYDFRQKIKPFCEKLLEALGQHMSEKLAHANSVGKLVTQFCLHAGMSAEDALMHGQAARMHDVGYISRPREAWRTEGKPDPELSLERKILHTGAGKALIDTFCLAQSGHPFLAEAGEMALLHHERIDGNGPRGIPGAELSRIVKIVGAIDAWDGDQIPKPGVEPRTPQEALDRLRYTPKYQDAYDLEIVEEFGQMLGLS